MSKIFIVDDDIIQHRIYHMIISQCQVLPDYTSFTEAERAFKFLEQNYNIITALPDVIILDLNMPMLDGWGFLEKFEVMKNILVKKIRIFIVSSSINEDDLKRSQSYCSVIGFFVKPLSLDDFRKINKRF